MDPSGKWGLANLTAKGLLLGTPTHSVTAFREALDFMGASLTASTNRDTTVLGLRVLKNDLDIGFDLLMEAITQPIFPEEEIQREVEKTLAAIQSAEERPGVAARKAFYEGLFSEKLAVVGDITQEKVRTRLIPLLSPWPMADIPKEHFTATFTEGPETVMINRNITQANIVFGHKGISRKNQDYYTLSVMNYILGGGGFGSRLFEEIRVKRGLAYSVTSYFEPQRYPGSFQIVLQTKNASAREAVSVLRDQMNRIRNKLISQEELERAKKYLVGSFPFRLDTQAKLANFLLQVEYYGLGLDYPERYATLIKAVTREDVLRVAKSYLHPANAILVIVANLREAGMDEPTK